MKLHFEPDLDYQLLAIEAVCDLFRGQETCRTEFTITQPTAAGQQALTFAENELGVGNRLTLLDEQIQQNLADIQLRHGLPPSDTLRSGDFTVEMETGTGKTYVYLRTIFELNKRYGFTKFVIVVPSVAIKEGVYKSLQVTEEHFKGLYAGVPIDSFLYNSATLSEVRNFATSPHIQVMVVTVGAINKKEVNNLYKDSEKTGGEKPIDLIRGTRPIVIVDEPQSVDGGLSGAGKKALRAMNPLCTLRYSATHADKHHMVYRLNAFDAYEQRLVKQIEVASATVEAAHNKPYLRLVSLSNKRGTISAQVELDIETARGVERQKVTVQDGDDLELITRRAVYANCRIGEIRTERGNEYLELRVPGGEEYLQRGQARGDVDPAGVQREMIRRTIHEHLEKEKRLHAQGIKVLSLFFIDEVAKYRQYDHEGNAVKGEYARIFEEEYRRAANLPHYRTLFEGMDLTRAAEEAHNGYFSIDKRGTWTNTAENNQANRTHAARAYNLIMKDKETLLSLGTPLKFIFSHSALKEGWDNPNIFQICTLRDMYSERERRQTIGRGLRLCVNQQGERIRGSDVNTLTVIARESYEAFAQNLQKEIEQDTGIRFGVIEPHQFAAITIAAAGGTTTAVGVERSRTLWNHLHAAGYINPAGKIQDALRHALRDGTLTLPDPFAALLGPVAHLLRTLTGGLQIKNADERRPIRERRAVLDSDKLQALWDRIKHKTTHRVAFNNEKLIHDCIRSLHEAPPIPKTRLQWRKADLAIGKAGVSTTERAGAQSVVLDPPDLPLPDLLTDLQNRTQLTRRSLQRILTESGRLDDFRSNPQQFIERAAQIINRTKRLALADGIKYQRLTGNSAYRQTLFDREELAGYLNNVRANTQESVYEHVIDDSESEHDFATELEDNDTIEVYARLPGWFTIPTPLGDYNPDWAVLVQTQHTERLYFVVGTKGSPTAAPGHAAEFAR